MAHTPAVRLAERYSIYCYAAALNKTRQASHRLEFRPYDPEIHRSCSTLGKGWATKAFFSDDGSTAVEVALKMAYRLFSVRHKDSEKLLQSEGHKKMAVVTQADCYHGMEGPCNSFTVTLTHPATHSYPLGDTLGVMDLAPPSIFNQVSGPVDIVILFAHLLAKC